MRKKPSNRSVGYVGCRALHSLALVLLLAGCARLPALVGADPFADWHVPEGWYRASDARLDTWNEKHLYGPRGEGVLINGRIGKTPSLITKRRDYRDVDMHVEFMVARSSNSGVIFQGNYEIQILDSYGVRQPTAGQCGGVYPPAEAKPEYHHLPGGSPPRVNAAKPAGQWQTLDIVFQAPRFNAEGKKTANAKFVRVVHNGTLIQENVEVPTPGGLNWQRPEHPAGPIILQGRTITTEFDGEVLLDHFPYHDWMLSMDPAPIGLQKHRVVHGENLGPENPCPIEYRNIFIKELGAGASDAAASVPSQSPPKPTAADRPLADLLRRIDSNPLPKAYQPEHHQDYVDRRMAELTDAQRARISQLWQAKQRLAPNMPNRGFSFVRIMEHVGEGDETNSLPQRSP